MTTAQTLDPVHAQQTEGTVVTDAAQRVSLREPLSTAGFIDGAWWPRSRDLMAELPALVEALAAAGHHAARFTYNLKAWDAAPKIARVGGHKVRLGGFATSDPVTVALVDTSGRKRIDLLVIDPATVAATAERALQLAGRSDSTGRAADIMAAARTTPAATR